MLRGPVPITVPRVIASIAVWGVFRRLAEVAIFYPDFLHPSVFDVPVMVEDYTTHTTADNCCSQNWDVTGEVPGLHERRDSGEVHVNKKKRDVYI